MQFRNNLFLLVCLLGLASISFAQDNATLPQVPPPTVDINDSNTPSFPYDAQIMDDNVNIRSGPGTNYYSCAKLSSSDKVKVVSSLFSWSHIVPPIGSFSWISKQYVSIDQNDPNVGIVTADAVRVYAGSEDLKPIYSTTMQLKLNRGDKVALMDDEKEGDYYKIVPPAGAYLWVSTRFIKAIGNVDEDKIVPTTESQTTVSTSVPGVAPTTTSVEAEKLNEYYALEKQIKAERAKPTDEQNYGNIKKSLLELADNKDAGKAARYSEFAIKQVKRFELALDVANAVKLQDAQLQQIQERIERACAAKLAETPDLGKFAVIGQLQTSNIYGSEAELKHYRIIDDAGKTICYAFPSSPDVQMNLDKLLGCKVGLVGTIEPHLQTGSALVRFTEIAELE